MATATNKPKSPIRRAKCAAMPDSADGLPEENRKALAELDEFVPETEIARRAVELRRHVLRAGERLKSTEEILSDLRDAWGE